MCLSWLLFLGMSLIFHFSDAGYHKNDSEQFCAFWKSLFKSTRILYFLDTTRILSKSEDFTLCVLHDQSESYSL